MGPLRDLKERGAKPAGVGQYCDETVNREASGLSSPFLRRQSFFKGHGRVQSLEREISRHIVRERETQPQPAPACPWSPESSPQGKEAHVKKHKPHKAVTVPRWPWSPLQHCAARPKPLQGPHSLRGQRLSVQTIKHPEKQQNAALSMVIAL